MSVIPLRQVEHKKPHSNRGRWRAAVLIGIHILFVLHLLHWKTAGTTISPVEPSEAMQTLELGYVNAGFIFFGILILGTLIFGRFFCGWGCHVVALQDLCAWLLGKIGIRPKPIRSRALVWVPTFAALYMFVWPQVLRLFEGRAFPELKNHLKTAEFWATFPGPVVAILTFVVCGFAVVYFLGAKGFCTYGCPYGAFFYQADRFAVGKIRVTDACEGCGHCTAVCTSNVRVHEEVAKFGAVVDAGCMKCMDCVDACPNDALYYGLGKPTVLTKKQRPRRLYDFTWQEELAMAAIFLISLYALRGLYDLVPFLLALGASTIISFVTLHGMRMLYEKNVRFARIQLRTKGKATKKGLAYGATAPVLIVFVVHSLAVQFYRKQGEATYDRADYKNSIPMLETAHRLSLIKSPQLLITLASAEAQSGNTESAAAWLKQASEIAPNLPEVRLSLARASWEKGDWASSVSQLNIEPPAKIAEQGWYDIMGDSLAGLGRYDEAIGAYRKSHSEMAKLRLPLAQARAYLAKEDKEQAVVAAEAARKLAPKLKSQLIAWSLILKDAGALDETVRRFIIVPQSDVETWYALCYLYIVRGDPATAQSIYQRLVRKDSELADPISN